MKRFLKWVGLFILLLFLSALSYVLYFFPPVMTGMDAKVMCSCVYVAGRTPESVKQKELRVFPGLTLADFTLNHADSTASAKLLWKTSKAIYRKGLGCTLISEAEETAVRAQKIKVAALRDPAFQDTIDWPLGNRISSFLSSPGINRGAVEEAVDNAFKDSDPEKPVFTHGVVVLHNGQIISERYADGMNYNTRLMGWSMTKSVVNALVGLLVEDGKLKISDPAPIQEWQNDDRRKITINDLLQASSGLTWSESYFIPTSDFHTMFIHRDDKAGFAASRELEHEPGTFMEYSSGTTNILSRIVRQELGDGYHAFPYTRLFHKLGMHTAVIEPDASGTFVGSSYCFASARDWARFGLLYLNDGTFNNERILPKGWVKYSTTPGPAAPKGQYGAQIWLNAGEKGNPTNRREPDLPKDAYFFEGFEENTVAIIPSRNLVVVRLGVTHHGNFNLAKLVTDVIKAIPEESVSPE
jgi:CubicO group peptidase (beta-lactamase class C family)